MSRIVVDTGVASYVFNWHSTSLRYLSGLRGSELMLSFMSVSELRVGALLARWGPRRQEMLEQFIQFKISPSSSQTTVWHAVGFVKS
jgi:predicted nucleic acid-binding protein